jgi:predicted dienelactone hydrolase
MRTIKSHNSKLGLAVSLCMIALSVVRVTASAYRTVPSQFEDAQPFGFRQHIQKGRPIMRHITCILLLVVLAVVAFPAQAQGNGPQAVGLRPDAPEYAKHGPFWVGTREFVIPDPDGERPLALTVWYPALNPDGDSEEITYTADYPAPALSVPGHALLNATSDADSGPYPLVIFSHGAWSTRYEGVDFTEHLASYGFVVAAADHTGNTFSEWGQDLSLYNVLRPRDVLRVIGYVEELSRQDATLKGLINTDQIAVTGHSFGGWTALAAAGAQFDLEAYQTWCGQNPQSDPVGIGICSSFLDHTDDLASLAGLQSVPEGLWPAIADPRVKAAVALAPGGSAAFGQDGLASVSVPVMIFAGSGDFITPSQYHANFAYDYLVSPKALVTLAGAGHFVYQNACTANPMAVTDINQFITCSDPVWDMNRAHDLINHLTTAFLLDVLKGDTDAHQALLPDAVQFAGIDYQTTTE